MIAARPDEESEASLLEKFAAAQDIQCPNCRGPVKSKDYTPADPAGNQATILFSCRSCNCDVPAVVNQAAFQDWFFPPDDNPGPPSLLSDE